MQRESYHTLFQNLLLPDRVERLKRLIQSKDNWDGEDAKACSTQSLDSMKKFLEKTNSKKCPNLALFLDYEGGILIDWFFDKNGKDESIVIRFLDNDVFYFESIHMEDSEVLTLELEKEIIQKIKSIQKVEN